MALKPAACPNWEPRLGLLHDSNAVEGCWLEDDPDWGLLQGLLLADTDEALAAKGSA